MAYVWPVTLVWGQLSADEFAEIHFIDANSTPVSAGLRYVDHEAAGEGYVVLFRGWEQDVVYYYDGKDDFRPIFNGAEEYQLGFHHKVGEVLLMTECSPAGDLHRPYALDLQELRAVRLPEEFGNIYRYTRRGADHLLSDSTLVLWDDGGIYAARPPYDVATPMFTPQDTLGQTILYQRVAGGTQLMIIAGGAAYLTDGSREGTKHAGPVYVGEDPTVVQTTTQAYLFNEQWGFNAVDLRAGTTRWWAYPEKYSMYDVRVDGERPIFYLYHNRDYAELRLFSVEGTPLDTVELPTHLPEEVYTSPSMFDVHVGGHHLYFEARGRGTDTIYLYYSNFDLSQPQILLADWDNGDSWSRDYRIEVPTSLTGDAYSLVLAQESRRRADTSHLYVVPKEGGIARPTPVLTFDRRVDLTLEYTFASGEAMLFSVSNEGYGRTLYLWNSKEGTAPEALGDVYGTDEDVYLEANGNLYRFFSRSVTELRGPNYQLGETTELYDYYQGWLPFEDRLVQFGRGYWIRNYSYDSDYRKVYRLADHSTDLETNIFNRTASSWKAGVGSFDGTVVVYPYLGGDDRAIVINDRGRDINIIGFRNTIQYLNYTGATDSTLVFNEDRDNVVRVYDRQLNSKHTIWDIDPEVAGEQTTKQAVHHRGEFYFMRVRPLPNGGSRLSLMLIDPKYPHPRKEVFGEDFATSLKLETGWNLFRSAGNRLFFPWPSRETVASNNPLFRLHSIATADTPDRYVYAEGPDFSLNHHNPLYRSARVTPRGLLLHEADIAASDDRGQPKLYRSDKEVVYSLEGAHEYGEMHHRRSFVIGGG